MIMQTVKDTEEELVEEFLLFDDWMGKYDHLIEMGKSLPIIDEKFKTDENLVKGCQSKVWLHAELIGNKIQFTADSDAVITKGIIALLIRVLSSRTCEEVINAELKFIDKIGLKEHLSPTRSNGLLNMIKQMKYYAIAFQSKK